MQGGQCAVQSWDLWSISPWEAPVQDSGSGLCGSGTGDHSVTSAHAALPMRDSFDLSLYYLEATPC